MDNIVKSKTNKKYRVIYLGEIDIMGKDIGEAKDKFDLLLKQNIIRGQFLNIYEINKYFVKTKRKRE